MARNERLAQVRFHAELSAQHALRAERQADASYSYHDAVKGYAQLASAHAQAALALAALQELEQDNASDA